MRNITLAIAAMFAVCANAQEIRTEGVAVEPVRQSIIPYKNAASAAAGVESESPYVEILAEEWTRRYDGDVIEYASDFTVPLSWLNRSIILRVGSSSAAFEVVVNGKSAGYTPDGAVPLEFNLTKLVHEGKNALVLRLLKSDAANALRREMPEGIAGVKVICQPSLRIRDIVYDTRLNADRDGIAEIGIAVKCDALNPKSSRLHYILTAGDSLILAEGFRDITLDMRRADTVSFSAKIPAELLWNAERPQMLKLDITNRIDGKISECICRRLGFRAADMKDGQLVVNGKSVKLNATDYVKGMAPESAAKSGYNCIRIVNGDVPESFYDACDRLGIYVISCSAIDTTRFPDSIAKGGNPTNAPEWKELFIGRNEQNYDYVKGHPSVIGYEIGKGRTTGICTYESYLRMKSLERRLPVLYEGVGEEWCSDKLK